MVFGTVAPGNAIQAVSGDDRVRTVTRIDGIGPVADGMVSASRQPVTVLLPLPAVVV